MMRLFAVVKTWRRFNLRPKAAPRRAGYLRSFLGLALTLSVSAWSPAFAQCPEGFTHIGKMERKTTGLEVKERVSVQLPEGFALDTSYQQASPSGQGGRAGSVLPQQRIPPGIYIVPGGSGSFGWAVSDPKMLDARTFQMYLYCSQDRGVLNTNWAVASLSMCVRKGAARLPPHQSLSRPLGPLLHRFPARTH